MSKECWNFVGTQCRPGKIVAGRSSILRAAFDLPLEDLVDLLLFADCNLREIAEKRNIREGQALGRRVGVSQVVRWLGGHLGKREI